MCLLPRKFLRSFRPALLHLSRPGRYVSGSTERTARMHDGSSALALVLGGDPALYAIVWLSLVVSLSATAVAAAVGLPLGALLALAHFRGRTLVIVVMNAFMGLPPVV